VGVHVGAWLLRQKARDTSVEAWAVPSIAYLVVIPTGLHLTNNTKEQ
jgi:hypothetical protein